MSIFDWKDEYSVGIKLIDEQHKLIINLMNELVESIRDKRESYIINDVLNDLKEYANYHFSLESNLFKKYKYEKAEAHNKEHAFFVNKIRDLEMELIEHQQCAPSDTLEYVCDWFKNHMLKTDIDYSNFFKSINVINEI